jgi:hypothetical protein
VLALLAVTPPAAAKAQIWKVNLAAGASLTTGGFGDDNNTGYNLIAGVGIKQPLVPFGFRVEGIYNEFSEKGTTGVSHANGVTANLTFDIPLSQLTSGVTLYGIGGLGYYDTHQPFFTESGTWNLGWNIGAGLRLPLSGFSAYIEARYHAVSTNAPNPQVTFVPLSFGVVF